MKVSNIVGMDKFHEEIPIHFVQHSEILSNLKSFFTISKLFGVPGLIFYENVITKSGACSLVNAWCLLLLLNQVFLLIVQASTGEDFVKISGPGIIMRLHVILIHLWSLIYSTKLSFACKSSPYVENRLKIYTEPESIRKLRNRCLACISLFVTIGFGMTLKSILAPVFLDKLTFAEVWEMYSLQNCKLDPSLLFHSSITSSYCLLSHLSTNFIWIFGDFLLLILSIILSKFFRRLNRGIRVLESNRFSAFEIDLIREHHGVLGKLVNVFDNALAFLNLINCVFNTAFVVLGGYAIFSLRASERSTMKGFVAQILCRVVVAALKLIFGMLAASYLHFKAHEALADIRTWPLTRDLQDFSINSSRIGVIQAFIAQLSNPSTGLTIGKLVTITTKLLVIISLGVGIFFIFTRITSSTCSGRRIRN